MKMLKRTITFASIAGLASCVIALLTGNPYVALGIVLAVVTGCFSLFTIGILTSAITADQRPQKSRNMAIVWIILKLPILAGLIMLTSRLGPDAERSFIWAIGLVYSLLLCLAWWENRATLGEQQSAESQD